MGLGSQGFGLGTAQQGPLLWPAHLPDRAQLQPAQRRQRAEGCAGMLMMRGTRHTMVVRCHGCGGHGVCQDPQRCRPPLAALQPGGCWSRWIDCWALAHLGGQVPCPSAQLHIA